MTPSDRPADASHERRPIHVFAAAGWTVGVALVVLLVLSLTETARPGAALDLVNQAAVQALAYSVAIFVMLRVYAPHSPMREALAVRPVASLHILLSALAGAGIAPAMAKLDALVLQRFPQLPEVVEQERHVLTAGRGTLVLALVVIVPLAEEVFFRGMLFTGIRRGRSAGTAMFATSLLYAVTLGSQLDARGAASAFVLALVLAWVRAQSWSVLSACAAHASYAAASLAPLLAGRELPGDVPMKWVPLSWVAVAMGAAICALVAGSLLGVRDARAAAARGEDE
jgi:membrane protease YdiL (CAAX protease family)